MRIVVAGAGNIGRHLAHDLHERRHDVTILEQDPATLERAQEDALVSRRERMPAAESAVEGVYA